MYEFCVLLLYHSGSTDPMKVDLPGPAKQVAAGGHHTVILMADGKVMTFGRNKVRVC